MDFPVGTFVHNDATSTFSFDGTLFRCIPHWSAEPLTAAYSLSGGRWNPPQTYETLYLFSSVYTARHFLQVQARLGDFSWAERQPDEQMDLVIVDWSLTGLADLTTASGLEAYGLPSTYPRGFEHRGAWELTQPLGLRIHNSGAPGLVTRSASETTFVSPMVNWAELAVFLDREDSRPALVRRLNFEEWFFNGS